MILVGGLATSCGDFLSEVPDNRTPIDDKEKIGELLTLAYPPQNHQLFTYFMSDNATFKVGATALDEHVDDAYHWRDFRTTAQDTPQSYWTGAYDAIKQANHALEYINKLYRKPDGSLSDEIKPYYAEALLSRAYCHYMLAQLWGKSYNPETAKQDLGIPYVKKVEKQVFVSYDRGTLWQTYKAIEEDLLEGLKYVDGSPYGNKRKLHWGRESASAFAARFYSIMGDFAKVKDYTSRVLSAKPEDQLRDLNGRYTKIDVREILLAWGRTTETANLLITPQYSNWFSYTFGRQRYGLSSELYNYVFRAPFGNRSLRWVWQPYGAAESMMLAKWGFLRETSGAGAQSGFYLVMNVLFDMEEVLLLRAESEVMLGNYRAAEQDILAYLSKRIVDYKAGTIPLTEELVRQHYAPLLPSGEANPIFVKLRPFYSIDAQQEIYLNLLYDLRRKEYFFTGNRWFDHKRFNTRVRHWTSRTNEMFLEPGDPRRELQIPEQAIAHGIAPNPR